MKTILYSLFAVVLISSTRPKKSIPDRLVISDTGPCPGLTPFGIANGWGNYGMATKSD